MYIIKKLNKLKNLIYHSLPSYTYNLNCKKDHIKTKIKQIHLFHAEI